MDLCKLPPYPLTGTTGSKCRIPRRVKVRSMLEKRRGLWISTLLDWWDDSPSRMVQCYFRWNIYLQLWLMTSINWTPLTAKPRVNSQAFGTHLLHSNKTSMEAKLLKREVNPYTCHFTNRESSRDTISSYRAAKKRGTGVVFWWDCCLFQEIWMTSSGSLPRKKSTLACTSERSASNWSALLMMFFLMSSECCVASPR